MSNVTLVVYIRKMMKIICFKCQLYVQIFIHLVLKPFHFKQGKKRFQNSKPMDDVAQRIIAAAHFARSADTSKQRYRYQDKSQ